MNKSSFQIFVEKLTLSSLTIIKVLLLSKFKIKLPKKDNEECIILGNGPSLNDFLAEYSSFQNDKEVCCVNFFARTDLFQIIKPKFYFITSPEYFKGEQKKDWIDDRNKTFKVMTDKVDWPMYLIVPTLAKKNKSWQQLILHNPNIKIVYFNNTPVDGFTWFKHLLYKWHLGMPRPHNVLIPSLMITLRMGFKKIYLTGADHSWTKDLFVTEQNEVLLSQKHFYDNKLDHEDNLKNRPSPQPMYLGGSQEKRKLHEVLIKFVHSFKAYWEVKEYADKIGSQVLNVTPASFIDAFERSKL